MNTLPSRNPPAPRPGSAGPEGRPVEDALLLLAIVRRHLSSLRLSLDTDGAAHITVLPKQIQPSPSASATAC